MGYEAVKLLLKRSLNGFRVHWHGSRCLNRVAVTFDDGPNREFTPKVLDVLSSGGVHATFFVLGERIGPHKDLLRRMIKEGHEIGNHTYSHRELPQCGWKGYWKEILRTDDILRREFNVKTKYLRLPKGNWRSPLLPLILLWLGKELVFWSVDPKDFDARSGREVTARLQAMEIRAGDIILLHDKGEQTIEALRWIIQEIQDKRLEAVTVCDLLAR